MVDVGLSQRKELPFPPWRISLLLSHTGFDPEWQTQRRPAIEAVEHRLTSLANVFSRGIGCALYSVARKKNGLFKQADQGVFIAVFTLS